jgi:hypothetical protein
VSERDYEAEFGPGYGYHTEDNLGQHEFERYSAILPEGVCPNCRVSLEPCAHRHRHDPKLTLFGDCHSCHNCWAAVIEEDGT